MSQPHSGKSRVIWIVVAVIGFVIVGSCCGFFGTIMLGGFPGPPSDHPMYHLVADGDRLYVKSYAGNEDWIFDAVPGRPGPIYERYQIQQDGKTGVLTINDGHGEIVKYGNSFDGVTWSPRSQAGYYTSSSDDGSKESLVKWSRKEGFKTILTTKDRLWGPKESLYGKFVTINVDDGVNEHMDKSDLYIVSLPSLDFTNIDTDGLGDHLLMIEKDRFLVSGWNPYFWTPSTGAKKPLTGIEFLIEPTVFQGRLWGIDHYTNVVRFDQGLTKIDLKVPFTKEFLDKIYGDEPH